MCDAYRVDQLIQLLVRRDARRSANDETLSGRTFQERRQRNAIRNYVDRRAHCFSRAAGFACIFHYNASQSTGVRARVEHGQTRWDGGKEPIERLEVHFTGAHIENRHTVQCICQEDFHRRDQVPKENGVRRLSRQRIEQCGDEHLRIGTGDDRRDANASLL